MTATFFFIKVVIDSVLLFQYFITHHDITIMMTGYVNFSTTEDGQANGELGVWNVGCQRGQEKTGFQDSVSPLSQSSPPHK